VSHKPELLLYFTGAVLTNARMETQIRSIIIPVSTSLGEVSAEIIEPPQCKAMLVLAHGAGAGMKHRFMVALSRALERYHIGSVRYNFLYMEKGKKLPDPPAIAERTVQAVIHHISTLCGNIPLFVAGKSFGGRMSSQHLSKVSSSDVQGLIFYGFPLHPENKPDTQRAAHLNQVTLPMLFLQGTKDKLADLSLIETVCRQLPTATLKKFDGADHSFKSGKKEFIEELAMESSQWIDTIISQKH
jgi:uncharacterized protein